MKITYEQIMSFDPCYDPHEKLGMPKDYSDTLENFIEEYRKKVKSTSDILWVLLRNDFLNDRDMRLFAVWSAQQVKHLMTDQRSLNALIVAEQYSFGEVDYAARAAARAAAFAAARAAARAAAFAAARAAALAAAWDAAFAAARAAAFAAARAAALAAAWDAALAAAGAAARDAAWDAARDAQVDKILDILKKPNGEWFERTKAEEGNNEHKD